MPCRFRDIGGQLATNCRGTTRDEPSLGINIDQIEKPFMGSEIAAARSARRTAQPRTRLVLLVIPFDGPRRREAADGHFRVTAIYFWTMQLPPVAFRFEHNSLACSAA
jgi:hypothetical protein